MDNFRSRLGASLLDRAHLRTAPCTTTCVQLANGLQTSIIAIPCALTKKPSQGVAVWVNRTTTATPDKYFQTQPLTDLSPRIPRCNEVLPVSSCL